MLVSPTLLCGFECWAIKMNQVQQLLVAEMRMIRWMYAHTRLDRVKNEVITDKVKVVHINDKMRENRLRWFSHIRRGSMDAPGRRCEKI